MIFNNHVIFFVRRDIIFLLFWLMRTLLLKVEWTKELFIVIDFIFCCRIINQLVQQFCHTYIHISYILVLSWHYIFLCLQICVFQIVVVFYVAIVLLLIGTNLRAGGAGRSARFKKHVVEFTEVTSNYLCVYHSITW